MGVRLYKVDVLEAVEHKAEKHGGNTACPRLHRDFLLKNNSRLFDGYMTALIDYADHIRDAGCKAFVDYEEEQAHLDRMRRGLTYNGANLRYNRGYKTACLALKSILHRLKEEANART